MFKLHLMYIYDITIVLWAIQWFFNPYPAMLGWELVRILEIVTGFFIGLPSLIYRALLEFPSATFTQAILSLFIILPIILLAFSFFVIQSRSISLWLLSLSGLSQSLSLTARYITGLEWLLTAVPFMLNQELVARGELCASAERGVVKVRIHPENGNPVEGVVVGCTIDKIAVDNGRERRVFSWGDVWQIELVR